MDALLESLKKTGAFLLNLAKGWPWWLLAGAIMGVVLGLAAFADVLGGTAQVGIFSSLLRLSLIPFAVATLFISLRIADKLAGLNWPTMRDKITSDPWTTTTYACTRWIAIALIIIAVFR